jgi:hypothetical protein
MEWCQLTLRPRQPLAVPIVAAFRGILIRMHYVDHEPPHFHAEHRADHATFLLDGSPLQGHLRSTRARRWIREWSVLNREALLDNWRRARRGETLERIAPLR